MLVLTSNSHLASTHSGGLSVVATGLKITDITGSITALCALFVAALSLWTVRRHNSLSVRPHISIVRVIENNQGMKEGLYLRNHGLGPALIDKLVIEIDTKKTVITRYQDLKQLFALYDFDVRDLGIYWMDLLPKDGCERFLWIESNCEAKKEVFKRLMYDVRLIVKYRSFYDEQKSASFEMREETEADARAKARYTPTNSEP